MELQTLLDDKKGTSMCRKAAERARRSAPILAEALGRSARLPLQGSQPSAPASAAPAAGMAIGRCTYSAG